jgi:hypothetical protein
MNDLDNVTLSEYADNPFIARLPPLVSQKDLYQQLNDPPTWSGQECHLPSFVRKHCIARLANCFFPQSRQVSLAERLGLLIRQGYVGRNPMTHAYIYHLHNGLDRIQARSMEAKVRHKIRNTASCFALLGCPGTGKTVAMNRVLAEYPQVIRHEQPFSHVQVVWLRLEAPALGSLRQLCIDFFDAIDQLIGTDYVKRYATGANVEQMVPRMAHVAQLHALGVLIIDEIQHLKNVKVGEDALLKFLVRLVNTIGVPVIPIGTMAALPILQRTFSQARRSTGMGSALWDRMPFGAEWDDFLRKLWPYQWTSPATPLTPELSAALYDETQGVADLAVKLFMLAQWRVVSASEVRAHQSEELKVGLFRRVAKEEFVIVRPMIDALRNNDSKRLEAFDDLRPLNDHVQSILESPRRGSGSIPAAPVGTPESVSVMDQGDLTPTLIEVLGRMGLAPDVAAVSLQAAIAENATGDPLELLHHLSKIVSKRRPSKRSSSKPTPPAHDDMPADDLRRLVAGGRPSAQSGYDVLRQAGVVRAPMLDVGGGSC